MYGQDEMFTGWHELHVIIILKPKPRSLARLNVTSFPHCLHFTEALIAENTVRKLSITYPIDSFIGTSKCFEPCNFFADALVFASSSFSLSNGFDGRLLLLGLSRLSEVEALVSREIFSFDAIITTRFETLIHKQKSKRLNYSSPLASSTAFVLNSNGSQLKDAGRRDSLRGRDSSVNNRTHKEDRKDS